MEALFSVEFIQNLYLLRKRLIQCVLLLVTVFLVLLPFSNELYHVLAIPLLKYLPEGGTLVATEITASFTAPLKLTLMISFLIALPLWLYQLWRFVAPGLYKNEKSLIFSVLVTSSLLFYLGMFFAYFIVFPLIFNFFVHIVPKGVVLLPDISQYLDLTLKLFLAFGFCFQVPVLIFLLVKVNLLTVETLRAKRPYVIVGAFIVGMLLTPPDVVSQIMLALPICVLFEVGLWIASRALRQESSSLRGT